VMSGIWGKPPWRIDAAVPERPLPARCDVAVVGAGLTGLAAAYALARMGVQRVAVIEAGRVGAGASGRTGGIVLEGTAIGPLDCVDNCLGALERLLCETGIDCGLRLCGCWELEHVDPDQPLLWRVGDAALRVCTSVPGGTIDPGALVRGLTQAVLDAGATIHEHCHVRRIEPGPPPRLHIANDVLSAAHVILATNAYTSALLSLPDGFEPALALAVCTERLEADELAAIGLAERMPFYTVDLPYLWGRPLDDGRVVFGSGLAFEANGDIERVDIGLGDAAAAIDRLEERIRGMHPKLDHIRIQTRWGGPIAFLVGRPPFLGWHPGAPGVLVAGGYTGHGVALSVRVGELAAAAITKKSDLPAWGALPRGMGFRDST
jgi:gamma-glutamylputrescine oxidase